MRTAMSTPAIISALAAALIIFTGAAGAQTPMKPTAPQKMMSPGEAKKMAACKKLAAERNVAMNERSRFVMDCMTGKAK